MTTNNFDKKKFLNHLVSERNDPTRASLWKRLHIDASLFISLLAITVIGFVVFFSASNENMTIILKQAMWFVIGFLLMIGLAQIHPNTFKQIAPIVFGISLPLLIAVLFMGHTGKGAQRWLNLGILRFQPSELMKLTLPIILACYFSNRPIPPTKGQLLIGLVILLVPVCLIAKQPDLGTAILASVAGIAVILFTGIRWQFILLGLLVVCAFVPIAWHFMHDYQQQRVLTFLNPELDPLGTGYHIIQSKIAIGSGGILGKGWLQGTQAQLDFLPEHSTDFIYCVLGEEFGLLGGIILLGLYAYICYRTLNIAYSANDNFSRFLASSLGFTFFATIFINIGMVCGLLPVVGVPLPLLSYGGTSTITVLASFGILMSISTHQKLVES